jgi:hypothetical protein
MTPLLVMVVVRMVTEFTPHETGRSAVGNRRINSLG